MTTGWFEAALLRFGVATIGEVCGRDVPLLGCARVPAGAPKGGAGPLEGPAARGVGAGRDAVAAALEYAADLPRYASSNRAPP